MPEFSRRGKPRVSIQREKPKPRWSGGSAWVSPKPGSRVGREVRPTRSASGLLNDPDDHRMARTARTTKRRVSPCAMDRDVLGRSLGDRSGVSWMTRKVLKTVRTLERGTRDRGEAGRWRKDKYDGDGRASCPELTTETEIRRIRRRRRIRCEQTADDKPGRRHRQEKRFGAMRTSPLLRANDLERIGRKMG